MRVTRLALTAAVVLGLASGVAGCGAATAPSGSSATASTPSSTTSTPSVTPTVPVRTVTPPGGQDPTDPPITSRPGPSITLTGVPEPGVENGCLLLQKYVLLGGDRALLRSGAPVTVTGHTQDDLASYCQQGTLLVVDTVKPAG